MTAVVDVFGWWLTNILNIVIESLNVEAPLEQKVDIS